VNRAQFYYYFKSMQLAPQESKSSRGLSAANPLDEKAIYRRPATSYFKSEDSPLQEFKSRPPIGPAIRAPTRNGFNAVNVVVIHFAKEDIIFTR
jgi:hypothetical protein